VRRTLVWDAPIRIFHWLLVAGFAAAYTIAVTGDHHDRTFVLHMAIGLVVGLMAVLRVVWGLLGTEHARFSRFALSPAALFRYARGLIGKPGPAYLGHNPAASYATVAMIIFALGLPITGLLLVRGHEGVMDVHEVFAHGFMVVSVIHILGVLWHAIRYRDGIVLAIVDGRKTAAPDSVSVPPRRGVALAFVVIVGCWAGALVAGYDRGSGTIDLPGIGWTIGGEHHEHHGSARGHDDDDDDDDHHGRRNKHRRSGHHDDD